VASTHYVWNQTFGGIAYDEGTAIVETADGGFAIAGPTASFGVVGIDEVWLVCCNENGTHLWNQIYGDSDIEAALEFAECNDGGFALFSLNYINSANSDAWFVRTAENGAALWNSTYGGPYFDQFFAGIITSNGDFVCVGTTYSFGAGSSDMYVVRIPDEAPLPPITIPPPIPGFPIEAILFGLVGTLGAILIYRKRKHG